MEGALHGVFLTGDETRVLHGVDDFRGVVNDDVPVAVRAIDGRGADFRMGHGDGLLVILDVLMAGDFASAAFKGLEHNEVGLVLDSA